VLLQHQDRSLWDGEAIGQATRVLARAATQQRPGPYQLQAAILACHAEAECWQDTDWEQIVLLYDMLIHLAPSPVTRLHRAVALRYLSGPRPAMVELDTLADELDRYHLYHATRADLWRALGRLDEALAADRRALALTANPAEQGVLRQRIARTYREEHSTNDD
jgi:RNA polymerase sigma-70 factor (ECF subfamily)